MRFMNDTDEKLCSPKQVSEARIHTLCEKIVEVGANSNVFSAAADPHIWYPHWKCFLAGAKAVVSIAGLEPQSQY